MSIPPVLSEPGESDIGRSAILSGQLKKAARPFAFGDPFEFPQPEPREIFRQRVKFNLQNPRQRQPPPGSHPADNPLCVGIEHHRQNVDQRQIELTVRRVVLRRVALEEFDGVGCQFVRREIFPATP